MPDEYQTDFSRQSSTPFNVAGRTRKAKTTLKVLEDATSKPLNQCSVLNVGSSTAIIDKYLAPFVDSITCIDIDYEAVKYAKTSGDNPRNLQLITGNAENLPIPSSSVDIVLCAHVYEHVPNPEKMMAEIERVMKTDGICYFAAGNRIMWREPHHNLGGLSLLPKPIANIYMRLAGKGSHYYETHKTYWSLKRLCHSFNIVDFTAKLIETPSKYQTEYMVKPKSTKQRAAKAISKYLYWSLPSYIWVLKKRPRNENNNASPISLKP